MKGSSQEKTSIFYRIAKYLNLTRLIIVNIIFLGIVGIILIALFSGEDKIIVPKHSILKLDLNGFIVDQKQAVDLKSQLSQEINGANSEELHDIEVDQLINLINYAKTDPNIEGISLELDGLKSAGLNHLKDIGDALTDFKTSKKTIVAFSEGYSQLQYYLASFSDQIYLDPEGSVSLQGFGVYRLYFKDALKKLLITPHIFKVGKYKSFVEPYTENGMSEGSKLANKHWLDQLWEGYISTILEQRKNNKQISKKSISPTISEFKTALIKADGDQAIYAINTGLVDKLKNQNGFRKELKAQGEKNGINFNYISFDDYLMTVPEKYNSNDFTNKVALIYGSGEIVSGEQSSSLIGGESFSKLLKQAQNDPSIKAVVIRLDTPGGSAFASEKIRQQLLSVKDSGKKVVVSMGSVAASGGYWIASASDHIVASKNTLTGSIGIFGMFVSFEDALKKFGIYNDGLGTTPFSSMGMTRKLSPEMAEILQLGIESGYSKFIKVVSEGRNMSKADVEKVAQGRVWTGLDAKLNGLVDSIGNLDDAIEEAAKLAGLQNFDIVTIYPEISTKQQLINELFSSADAIFPMSKILSPEILKVANELKAQTTLLSNLNDPQGRYAVCSICQIK